MMDKIKAFQGELDGMQPVKNALFGKQNPSVADKLCIKLEGLFSRTIQEITVAEVTKDPQSKEAFKDLLIAMLKFAQEMKTYQDYLKHLVENVQTVANNMAAEPAQEMSQVNAKSLQLTNPNAGNV